MQKMLVSFIYLHPVDVLWKSTVFIIIKPRPTERTLSADENDICCSGSNKQGVSHLSVSRLPFFLVLRWGSVNRLGSGGRESLGESLDGYFTAPDESMDLILQLYNYMLTDSVPPFFAHAQLP